MSTTSKQEKNSPSEKKQVSLSASKIKTFQTCSWLFYAKYFLKVPDKSNSGAKRGTVTHLILEVLLNKRHHRHLQTILDTNNVESVPSIKRLILKTARKLNVDDEENLNLIYAMILTGLKHDFLCDGALSVKSEVEFKLASDTYIINGFIDKEAKYKDKIVIFDYKTSKQKFSLKELEENIQNLMYSLACLKNEGIIPEIYFLFLKFSKTCKMEAPKPTLQVLKGFEHYLSYLAEIILSFDEKKALENLAAKSKESRWLCGKANYPGELKDDGTEVFCCSCKFGFKYYHKIEKSTGKIIESAFEAKDLKESDGYSIIEKEYSGCPAFKQNAYLTTI